MNLRTPRRIALVGAVATAVLVAIGGVAVGTTGSGVTGGTPLLARGTAEDKIKTRGHQPFDVVAQSLTIAPGGHTGWHSHPGQAIVVIKSGTFTTYAADKAHDSDDAHKADDRRCNARVYRAGQVYVDPGYGRVHIARNEGTVPLELHVTYLDVPVAGPFRIDADNPGNCPF